MKRGGTHDLCSIYHANADGAGCGMGALAPVENLAAALPRDICGPL
eukprot:CAMPEP_0172794960 /NCGR_PEP_ID=MMETSP1074-20121228/210243_1 /TAXON_ID=2916 /ORGANISM="Ceratium fusus, Strain PA161109" /LENGTH=45 /DNA_ID= /DNA_START= /DNA_END= /DNA_ORIENTATION=